MSVTLTQLVNFLTRPLLLTGSTPPLQLTHLQLSLYNNFPTGFVSPFTLHLSPHSLPITSIYAACLAAGVDWHNWVRSILLLSGGAGEMYIFVMEGTIRVCVDGGKTVTVWTEEPSDDEVPAIAVSRSRVHVNHKVSCPGLAPLASPSSLTTGSITCASRTASFPSTAATTTTTTAAPSKFINTTTTGADAANANNYNAITDMSASPSPMTIKLQAMIDSVRSCTRSRNPKVGLAQGAGNAESRPIRLPTLPVIPSLSIISSSSSSSSRVGVTTSSCSMPSSPYIPSVIVLPIDIDELTVPVAVASAPCSPILSPVHSHTPIYVSSDSEEDSDSDNESTTSSGSTRSTTSSGSTTSTHSRFSSRSTESFTSVSTSASSDSAGRTIPYAFYKSKPQPKTKVVGHAHAHRVPLANNLDISSMGVAMDMDIDNVDTNTVDTVVDVIITDTDVDKPLHPSQLELVSRGIGIGTQTTSPRKRIITPPTNPRTRMSPSPPGSGTTTDKEKEKEKEVTKYTYQGGQTGVITGGVMLGSGSLQGGLSKKKSTPSFPRRATSASASIPSTQKMKVQTKVQANASASSGLGEGEGIKRDEEVRVRTRASERVGVALHDAPWIPPPAASSPSSSSSKSKSSGRGLGRSSSASASIPSAPTDTWRKNEGATPPPPRPLLGPESGDWRRRV